MLRLLEYKDNSSLGTTRCDITVTHVRYQKSNNSSYPVSNFSKKLNTNGVPIISKKTMQTFEHHADVIKKPNTEHFD